MEVLWPHNPRKRTHHHSSQSTYHGSMLDLTDTQLKKIQRQLNNYVLDNADSPDGNAKPNNWIKADTLYAPSNIEGKNLINVKHYFR